MGYYYLAMPFNATTVEIIARVNNYIELFS